jgi:hypothetical protein
MYSRPKIAVNKSAVSHKEYFNSRNKGHPGDLWRFLLVLLNFNDAITNCMRRQYDLKSGKSAENLHKLEKLNDAITKTIL